MVEMVKYWYTRDDGGEGAARLEAAVSACRWVVLGDEAIMNTWSAGYHAERYRRKCLP